MTKLEYLKEIQAAEEQGLYDPSKDTPDFISLSIAQHYYREDYDNQNVRPLFLPYPPVVERGDNTALDLQIMIPYSGKAQEDIEATDKYQEGLRVYNNLLEQEKSLINSQDKETDKEKLFVLLMSQLKEISFKKLTIERRLDNLKRIMLDKYIQEHAATYANRTQELKEALEMSICIFFHDARSYVNDSIEELLSLDAKDEIDQEMAKITAVRLVKITQPNLLNELFYNAVRNNTGLYRYILFLKENDNTAYMEVLECIDYCLREVLKKRDENKSDLKKLFKALIPKQPSKALPLPQMPKRPNRYIVPNNTLINAMTTKNMINAGAGNLPVSKEKGITSYVMILDTNNPLADPYKLTNFERIVFNAICSIYQQATQDGYNKIVVTPTSIYKAMPGGSEKPTPKMIEQITTVVEKVQAIDITLDATRELAAYKRIEDGEKLYTKEKMVLAKQYIYVRRNQKETVGWELLSKPALLDYAEKSGEIISVPAKVIQIPEDNGTKKLSINEKRRELWDYLTRRVEVIKRAHKQAIREMRYKRNNGKTVEQVMGAHGKSPVILYETAFNAVNITTTNRAVLKDNKDFCKFIMSSWVDIGFIHGYEEVKQGNTFKGIKILFH
jgi:hypothetical protein